MSHAGNSCLFSEAAERAVSGLEVVVQLCVLVLEHERTPVNILRLSPLIKQLFLRTVEAFEMPLNLSGLHHSS